MKHKAVVRLGVVVALTLALWLGAKSSEAAGRVMDGNRGREGQSFDVGSVVSRGSFTLVDFWSPHCGPCVKMAPYMEKLAAKRSDLKVVKLNIDRPGTKGIDWKSPLAQQYKIKAIPYLVIFDKNGKEIANGQRALNLFVKWLKQAGLVT